jgi:hypothetical protein
MSTTPVPMPSLARFTRLARLMQSLTTATILFIGGLTVFAMYSPGWMHELAVAKLGSGAATFRATPLSQVLAGLVLAIPVGVTLFGLFAVRRLFADFVRGDLLSERAARHLQVFATTVLLQAPLSLLTSAGLSAALSLGSPPGSRSIMVGFSSADCFALIVGGVLLAAVTVMREAARVADENASIV